MSAEVKRGRGRPSLPPELQRQRLLDAAERRFECFRYENVGAQDIASEAGMSTRSFYQFFSCKEDLVVELAAARAELFLEEMTKVMAKAENALEAADRSLPFLLERLRVVVVELGRMAGTASERVQAVRDIYRGRIGAQLFGEISQRLDEGLFDEMPDVTAMMLVMAGIEGLIMRYHTEGRRKELVALHPRILEALVNLYPDHLNEEMKLR